VLGILALSTIPTTSSAQLPCLNPDIIYIQNGSQIYNFDITLPISATNPILNTIGLPSGSGGLAVSNNLNCSACPSPTFYTVSGGNFWYYDGAAWINTGHNAGAGGAINHGGGGGFIYNLVGSSGTVYQYDGTGPATLLLVVPGFSGGGPYDLVGDCNGNFYILRTNTTGGSPFLRLYSSTGTLVQSWTVTGSSNPAGGGFGIIGNQIFYHNGGGFHTGTIGATNVNFTPGATLSPSGGDWAVCPVGGNATPTHDTIYYCGGAPGVNLTASSSGGIYNWFILSGTGNLTGTGNSRTFTSNASAVITVTNVDTTNTATNCGGGMDTFTVIVPEASIDAGLNKTLAGCGTYTDTLNASLTDTTAGVNYTISWSPAANILSGGNTLNPVISQTTGPITYVVTVSVDSAQGGCVFQDSLTIDVENFQPIPNFTWAADLGCFNDTVNFTNTSITNPNGNPQYAWTFGDGGFSSQANPTYVYFNQGTYNVKLIVTDNGCIDSIIIPVTVSHPLNADFITTPDSVLCLGETVNVSTASIPLLAIHRWYWGNGDSTLFLPVANYTYTAAGTYNIKLVITDFLGCKDSITKPFVVVPKPYAQMSATPTEVCVGEAVYFSDSVSPGTFQTFYDFDDGTIVFDVHNPTHNFELPGNPYNVTFTSRNPFCSGADSVLNIVVPITVNGYPALDLGPDIGLCPTESIELQDNINPSAIYVWSTGDTANKITVTDPGRYWAMGSNGSCFATDSIWVTRDCYINVPNSFSPNGDGLNDYFFPRDLLSSGVTRFDMKIFNRWGELIFRTDDINGRGWDGRYGGELQPMGAYVYVMEATLSNGASIPLQGNVTLVR